jgi:hypothetical protein
MILTKFGHQALGGIAFTVVFLGAILLEDRLGHQWDDLAPLRVQEDRASQWVGVGNRPVPVVAL